MIGLVAAIIGVIVLIVWWVADGEKKKISLVIQ